MSTHETDEAHEAALWRYHDVLIEEAEEKLREAQRIKALLGK